MQKEPPPFVWAAPNKKNTLTCEPAAVHCQSILILSHQGITLSCDIFYLTLQSIPITHYLARPP